MNQVLSLTIIILLLISGNSIAQSSIETDLSFNIQDSISWRSGTDGPLATRASYVQPDDKIIIAGDFTTYNGVTVNGLARLLPDGELDLTFNAGDGLGSNSQGVVSSIAVQSDGKILIAGSFISYSGIPANRIVRLNANGTLDNSFNVGAGANSFIRKIVLQADGKVLLIGGFNQFSSNWNHHALLRLNPDGSVDNSFLIGSGFPPTLSYPSDIAVQSDGKIIVVGGLPTIFNGDSVGGIFRLFPDGSLDGSFDIGTGTSSPINKVCIQQDGKLLVAGYFNSFNGNAINYMVRLNVDGSVDNSFNVGDGGDITQMAQKSTGEIAVIGEFNEFNNVSRMGIVYLNSDGSINSTYNGCYEMNYYPASIGFQSNGKLIITGSFGSFHFISGSLNFNTGSVTRFTETGFIDPEFNKVTGFDYAVSTIKVQSDNKILVGGQFYTYNRKECNHIARLNPDGTGDSLFNANIGKGAQYPLCSSTFTSVWPRINDILIYSDGKILLLGEFTEFNDFPSGGIVRLHSDGTIDNLFISDLTDYAIRGGTLQPDGKILAITSSGQLRRLNSDGTIDNTFAIGVYAPDGIVLQSDGKIIVANGTIISRVNPDGSADNTFNAGTIPTYSYGSFLSQIKSLLLQPDGKIVISGRFDQYNGLACTSIIQLNADGTMAAEQYHQFSGLKLDVETSTLQSDGKFVVFGYITDINNSLFNRYMLRFNTDGSLFDSTNFNSNSTTIYDCAQQNDGKLLIGGDFSYFGSVVRNHLMRFVDCQPIFTTQNVTEQFTYTWPVNGMTYTTSGQFFDTIPNFEGCDSILILNLTITEMSVTCFTSPSYIDSCNGVVNLSASGTPNFTFDIGNGSIITSSQYAVFDSLCPGIYSVLVTDGNGDTLTTTFVVPSDSTYLIVDPFGGVVTDSAVILLDNCDIDYNSIDSVYIDSYTVLTGDSVLINWAIVDMNGITVIPSIVVLTPGNSYLQLQLYCTNKSADQYFVATIGINYDGNRISTLGLDAIQNQLFEIYPNPANNQVHISFSGSNAELIIYDVQGKVVLKDRIQNQGIISLENFERGVYLFDFKNSNGQSVLRVVKN